VSVACSSKQQKLPLKICKMCGQLKPVVNIEHGRAKAKDKRIRTASKTSGIFTGSEFTALEVQFLFQLNNPAI